MGKAARISALFHPDNTFHSHSIYSLFWMTEQIASNTAQTTYGPPSYHLASHNPQLNVKEQCKLKDHKT